MNEFPAHKMLFSRHRFIDGARVLGIVFTQINDDILHARLFDAMRGRYNEMPRNQNTAALITGDANVRLPRIFAKLGSPTADDSFLYCVL